MGYEDFVYFILSEEDKTNNISLDYWFKCIDLDCDGALRPNEMLARGSITLSWTYLSCIVACGASVTAGMRACRQASSGAYLFRSVACRASVAAGMHACMEACWECRPACCQCSHRQGCRECRMHGGWPVR
jgi:hypothetical protein